MTDELKAGAFGLIVANGTLYKKEIHGTVLFVDEDTIIFRDNYRRKYTFDKEKVISFTPLVFKAVDNFSTVGGTT